MEKAVLFFIQDHLYAAVAVCFMTVFSYAGSFGLIWFVFSFAAAFIKKNRHIIYAVVSALAISFIVTDLILKGIIRRDRPYEGIYGITPLITGPVTSSFPSGHASSSFAAAAVLARYMKKYSAYIYLAASLVSISRLYLMVHYPTDILAGALIGYLIGKAVSAASGSSHIKPE